MLDQVSIVHVLTAVSTSGICIAFYRSAKPGTAVHATRPLKGHLEEFGRAWLLLAGFYWLRVFITPFLLASPGYRSLYFWHLVAMTVCAATNLYLRRAVLEIELEDDGERQYLEDLVESPRALETISARVVAATTNAGLFWGYAVSVLLLTPNSVLPFYEERLTIAAYWVQLLVSSFLFLRLSLVYVVKKKYWVAGFLASCYGVLEASYPIFALGAWHFQYELVLTIGKVLLAVGVIAATAQDAKASPESEVSGFVTKERLSRFGYKIGLHARWQNMLLGGLALSVLACLLPAIVGLYRFVISRAESYDLWPWAVMLCRLAVLFFVVWLIQLCTVEVFARLRYRIGWKRRVRGVLSRLFRLVEPSFELPIGWKCTSLARVGRVRQPQGKHVVLIHGLFSSGDTCWGFLPAILFERSDVSEVHVLTYRHRLWSTRGSVRRLARELGSVLASVGEGGCQLVIFGHSLGGLLGMMGVLGLAREQSRRALRRLRHLVVVGSPLAGSWLARLLWPWPWCRTLGPGSKFVLNLVQEFGREVPPPGFVIGEEADLCTFSYLYGSRDLVVGPFASLVDFPGGRFEVASWHAIPSVYSAGSPQAQLFLRQFDLPLRSVVLMSLLISHLAGRLVPVFSALFEFQGYPPDLDGATVVGEELQEWGRVFRTEGGLRGRGGPASLEAALRQKFEELSAAKQDDEEAWPDFWNGVKKEFGAVRELRRPVSFPWFDTGNLIIFFNREAGGAVVLPLLDGALASNLRPSASSLLPSGIGRQVKGVWEEVDDVAVESMFSCACGGVEETEDGLLLIEEASVHAAFDSDGNYFGVYERKGRITEAGMAESLRVHIAGPRARFVDLAVVALDMIEGEPLEVERLSGTARCNVWRLRFSEPKEPGSPFHLRWYFTWPFSMRSVADVDGLSMPNVDGRPAVGRLVLQLPGTWAQARAGEVRNQAWQPGRLTTSERVPDRGLYKLGIEAEGEGLGGLLVYYRLHPSQPSLLSFQDMVQIGPVAESEIRSVHRLENSIEGRFAATKAILEERRRTFPWAFLAARLADQVVGYAEACPADLSAEINAPRIRDLSRFASNSAKSLFVIFIGVVASLRGRGVGRRLLGAVEDVAKRRGMDEVVVVAFENSVAFFLNRGYVEVNRAPNYREGREGIFLSRRVGRGQAKLASPGG